MTKRAKSPSPTPDQQADLTASALEAAVRVLFGEIQAAEKTKPGSKKRAAVPRLAAQLVDIQCELRKAQKAQLDEVRDLTREKVLAWARTQTPETRARVVKDVAALDIRSQRSVLG